MKDKKTLLYLGGALLIALGILTYTLNERNTERTIKRLNLKIDNLTYELQSIDIDISHERDVMRYARDNLDDARSASEQEISRTELRDLMNKYSELHARRDSVDNELNHLKAQRAKIVAK